MALPTRPDTKEFCDFMEAAKEAKTASEAGTHAAKAYKYMCVYYEGYITSLQTRVEDLRHSGETILAELLEIKALVKKEMRDVVE